MGVVGCLVAILFSLCLPTYAGHSELQGIVETLTHEVEGQSNLLVRLLQLRDKRAAKLDKQFRRMTAILKDYSKKNGTPTNIPQPSLLFPKHLLSLLTCPLGGASQRELKVEEVEKEPSVCGPSVL